MCTVNYWAFSFQYPSDRCGEACRAFVVWSLPICGRLLSKLTNETVEMIWPWVRLYWQLRSLFCQHFTWFWDCQTTRLISACRVWLSSYVLRTGSAYGPSRSGENCHPEWSQRLHYEGKLCNQEQPTWKSGPTSEVSNWWLTFGAPDQHIIKG